MTDKWYTVSKAARLLGISPETVRFSLAPGELTVVSFYRPRGRAKPQHEKPLYLSDAVTCQGEKRNFKN